MSSSIAATTPSVSLARPEAASAPTPSRNNASASKGAGTIVTDTVSLSAKAQMMLAISDDLAKFETQFKASQTSVQAGKGSLTKSYEGGAIAFGSSGAATSAVVSRDSFGIRCVTAFVNGSAAGNDVIDVAAFVDPQPNMDFQTYVKAGDGDNTITAATNGEMFISAGNGNNNITSTTTGLDARVFTSVGSGDNTITVNGSGVAQGGSGHTVINLDFAADKNPSGYRLAAVGMSGSGTTIINGHGPGCMGVAGGSMTTINNVDDATICAMAGTSIVNLDNEAYSQVRITAGSGSTTVNLSDPADGMRTDTHPYAPAAVELGFDKQGHRIPVVSADADGNFSGNYSSYLDVLPTQDQAGYGLAHTRLDFTGISADQVSSSLEGSKLTLTVNGTREKVTVNNYQAGRVTFTFADSKGSMIASRQPPGLSETPAQ